MWYLPGLDQVLPTVIGVLSANVILALVVYAFMKGLAMLFGYCDVRYLHRVQYQNEYATQLNPYLLKEIRKSK